MPTTDSRHEARKLALGTLYCWLFAEIDEEQCKLLTKELITGEGVDQVLAEDIIRGVKENIDYIDSLVEKHAPEWPIDKISKIDLVILRIAIFELLFKENIPEKVAIDEAVELAKEFGNETSSKFVNGVLGTIAEEKKDE